MATENTPEEGFDPNRRLCPDGSCVGIVGKDGRCSLCGTRATGAEGTPPAPESTPPHQDVAAEDVARHDAAADRDDEQAAFDANRRLCSDGACIGVIGRDHRCSVCGRPAES
jgi:hypothetical protein